MASGEFLQETVNVSGEDSDRVFDYMLAIGMPQEFADATSGEFLSVQAAEMVGATAVSTTVETERPFGDAFFVITSKDVDLPVAAKKRTPGTVIGPTVSPEGKQDIEVSDPDWA